MHLILLLGVSSFILTALSPKFLILSASSRCSRPLGQGSLDRDSTARDLSNQIGPNWQPFSVALLSLVVVRVLAYHPWHRSRPIRRGGEGRCRIEKMKKNKRVFSALALPTPSILSHIPTIMVCIIIIITTIIIIYRVITCERSSDEQI